MNSKKKLIIAVCSLGVVALSAVIALVAVIAAFNATATSGIKISYTARNVNATISGAKWGYAIHGVDGAENAPTLDQTFQPASISFTDADTDETVTKQFEDINAQMTNTNTRVYVLYTIKNDDSTNGIKLTASSITKADSNIKVEYAVLDSATIDTTVVNNADLWSETIDGANGTIDGGATKYIAVRFKMVNRTIDVDFAASVSFQLSVE